MRVLDRSGIGLTLLVALIAILGIVVLSSGRVLENSMRQTQLKIDQAKAYYLAQAGVIRAAWNWYVSDTTTETTRTYTHNSVSGSNGTTVVGNSVFKFGYDGNEGSPSINQANFAYYASTSTPPITFIKQVAEGFNKTAGTTVSSTVPAAGVAQNNFLVVYFVMDGAAGAVSCADSQGNTYTLRSNAQFATPGAGNVRASILSAPVTTALVNGNTITVTHPSVTARAMTVLEFSGLTSFDVQNAATGTGTAANSGTAATNFASELLAGAIGVEGVIGDAFTAGASYTTNTTWEAATSGGTAATNVTINPEYRIVGATGTYGATGTPAGTNSRDWAAAFATFYNSASDTANWFTSGTDRRLRQWRLYNIHSSSSITLDQIKVSWSPTNAAVLNDFVLNGTSVWPGGTAASGSTINVTNTALTSGSSWGGTTTYLQWNADPPDPVTVTVQFIYSGDSTSLDAKSHEVTMWTGAHAAAPPAHRTFTVLATGEVTQTTGGYFKVLESVKAAVSGAPGTSALEIMDWDEADKNIP